MQVRTGDRARKRRRIARSVLRTSLASWFLPALQVARTRDEDALVVGVHRDPSRFGADPDGMSVDDEADRSGSAFDI